MNETVPEDVVSEYGDFFVRLVALLQNAFLMRYFASRRSKRVEIAREGFSELQERSGPQKICLGVIFREKSAFKSFPNLPEASSAPEDFGQSTFLTQ